MPSNHLVFCHPLLRLPSVFSSIRVFSNESDLLISSVQSLSHVRLFVTPWTATHQASLSIINSWSLLKLMSIKSVIPSNHLILCRPLLLQPSIFPSIRVFSNESVLRIRWPKYWSFNFSISSSNEYSGLISFRIDWFDLLSVQGTLKSLLQLHNSKASILQCSAFFMVQLSHPYMTTGKTMAPNYLRPAITLIRYLPLFPAWLCLASETLLFPLLEMVSPPLVLQRRTHTSSFKAYLGLQARMNHLLLFVFLIFFRELGNRLFFLLTISHGMWDLSSPTKDRTLSPYSGSAES